MLWLIIAVLIIIADQAVKYLVVSGMNVGDTAFSILNLFDITYIQNKGAAFSLLSGTADNYTLTKFKRSVVELFVTYSETEFRNLRNI